MNEHTMNIDDLISHYIDGELSGEAEAELHHRLSVSPDDRRRFREQIMLRGVAADIRMLDRPTPAMRAALFARLESEEGMSAAAATAAALAAPAGTAQQSTAAESAPAHRTFAADRPATGRRTTAERDRRRRLVPLLLPFLIGVIVTGAIWQFLEGRGPEPELAMNTEAASSSAPRDQSSGPFAVRGETDAGSSESAGPDVGSVEAGTDAGQKAGASKPDAEAAASDAAPDAAGSVGASGSSGASRSSSASGSGASGSAIASHSADAASAPSGTAPTELDFGDRDISSSRDREGRVHESLTPVRSQRSSPLPRAMAPPSSSKMTLSTARGGGAGELAHAEDAAREESFMTDGAALGGDDSEQRAPSEAAVASVMAEESDPAQGGGAAKMAPEPAWKESPSRRDLPQTLSAAPPSDSDDAAVPMSRKVTPESRPESRAISAIVNPMEISPLEQPERGAALMSHLRQNMLIGMKEREMRPEMALRLGGQFAGGTHEVYGVVGYTTFRESRSRSSREFRYDASVPAQEYLYSAEQTATTGNASEFWGGAGYRINVVRGGRWQAGAGAWAGYGQRYARAGAELPVAYAVSRTVRIELIPSVQYVTAHGPNITDVRTTSQALGANQRQVVAEQTEVTESEIRAGIGLGVTVVME